MNCDETAICETSNMLQSINDAYVTRAVCRYGQLASPYYLRLVAYFNLLFLRCSLVKLGKLLGLVVYGIRLLPV